MSQHHPPPTKFGAGKGLLQPKPQPSPTPGSHAPPPTKFAPAAASAQPKMDATSHRPPPPPPTRFGSAAISPPLATARSAPMARTGAVQRMERPSTPLPGDEDQERLDALGYSYPSDEENNTFFFYAIGKPKKNESMNCWQALLYFLIEKGYLLKAAAEKVNSVNAYEEPERFMSLLTDGKKHYDVSNIDPGRVLCFFSPNEGLIHVGLSQGNGKMWSHLSESRNGIQDIAQYLESCETSEMTKNARVESYRIKPEFKV